jgi:hypothetical protein
LQGAEEEEVLFPAVPDGFCFENLETEDRTASLQGAEEEEEV